MTKIVNLKNEKYDVDIRRPNLFGNPYPVAGNESIRKKSILAFKYYFQYRLAVDAEFRQELLQLKDKTLGCVCKPLPCHGDIVVELLNSIEIPNCVKCGISCDMDINFDPLGNPIYAPNQNKFRALYFNAEKNVDFCGPYCSLEHYNEKISSSSSK